MAAKHGIKMTRAVSVDGIYTSISEVPRGKKCDCLCIDCETPLVAKKGEVKAHHFSHDPDYDHTNCSWGLETELHLLAKEALAQSKKLKLKVGIHNPYVYELQFEEVILEKTLSESRRRPDVVGYLEGEKLLIEIAVTHFADSQKRRDLKKQNLNAIELDFSDFEPKSETITVEEVFEFLQNASSEWLSISPAGFIGQKVHAHERNQMHKIQTLIEEHRKKLEELESRHQKAFESKIDEINRLNIICDELESDIEDKQSSLNSRNLSFTIDVQSKNEQLHALDEAILAKSKSYNRLLEEIRKLIKQAKIAFRDEEARLTKVTIENVTAQINRNYQWVKDETARLNEKLNIQKIELAEQEARAMELKNLAGNLSDKESNLTKKIIQMRNLNTKLGTAYRYIEQLRQETSEWRRKIGHPWPVAQDLIKDLRIGIDLSELDN